MILLDEHEYFYKPTIPKYSTDDSTIVIDNRPMFAEARRHWHTKQQQSTSSNSTSSTVSNRATPEQEDHNNEYADTRSIMSEEYPYDY